MSGTTNFPLTAEDGHDDLPRTLRRAREEREQAKREAERATNAAPEPPKFSNSPGSPAQAQTNNEHLSIGASSDAASMEASEDGVVRRLDIPFLHLMAFFIKAVFAAVPAMLLLIALLWGFGNVLEALYPEFIKMKIQIYFPH